MVASRFKKVEQIQSLAKLNKVCSTLFARVHFETDKDAKEILEKIEVRMKREFPTLQALTVEDLKYANQSNEGGLRASFQRAVEDGPRKRKVRFQATVTRKDKDSAYELMLFKMPAMSVRPRR